MKNTFAFYQKKYPNHSDLLVFFRMVHAEGTSNADSIKWFKRLVPKDDYPNMNSNTILKIMSIESVKKAPIKNGSTKPS